MTLIRVNPESVQRYGFEAQSIFDEMHAGLAGLVDLVVAVRYDGPNAVAFKTECGRLASDFANRLHADMSAMAEAVRASTSNIAAALGGSPVSIRIDGRPIAPAAPAVVDFVDVETSELEGVLPPIAARFESLRNALTSHLGRLQATDWEGNAKLAAVDAVSGFTASARASCDAAEQSISGYVRQQLQAVIAADR
jgi:hypothetical protein